MRKFLLISSTATALFTGTGLASAQHQGEVRFSREHGHVIREYATGQGHRSLQSPDIHVRVGEPLHGSVDVHPLPESLRQHVPSGHQYGYGIVNDHPVIVEHSTRRVIHSFDD